MDPANKCNNQSVVYKRIPVAQTTQGRNVEEFTEPILSFDSQIEIKFETRRLTAVEKLSAKLLFREQCRVSLKMRVNCIAERPCKIVTKVVGATSCEGFLLLVF